MRYPLIIENLEFGNKAQINQLKNHLLYEADLLEGSVDLDNQYVEVNVAIKIYFPCAQCGSPDLCFVANSDNVQLSHGLTEMLYNSHVKNVVCEKCKCEYKLYDVTIYMVKNPLYPEKLESEAPNA